MNHYHGAVQVSGRVGAGAVNDMEPYYPLKEGEEAHWEVTTNDVIARSHDIHVMGHIAVTFFQVVERILFLYAKTNKGIGYVQVSRVCVSPVQCHGCITLGPGELALWLMFIIHHLRA